MKKIGTIELETSRLILRKVKIKDATAMFEGWCNDPMVTKYLPWDVHGNINVTNQLLNMWVNEYSDNSTFRWGVELKDNHELIGTIDVVNKSVVNNTVEVGYCYKQSVWHKGYGREALSRVIKFLFEEVDIYLITAKHNELNVGSGKVMASCGMKKDAVLRARIIDKFTKERDNLVYYSITKDEYIDQQN